LPYLSTNVSDRSSCFAGPSSFSLHSKIFRKNVIEACVGFLAGSSEVKGVEAVVARDEDVVDNKAGNQSEVLRARDTWNCGRLIGTRSLSVRLTDAGLTGRPVMGTFLVLGLFVR
jgi:hypothetical protein